MSGDYNPMLGMTPEQLDGLIQYATAAKATQAASLSQPPVPVPVPAPATVPDGDTRKRAAATGAATTTAPATDGYTTPDKRVTKKRKLAMDCGDVPCASAPPKWAPQEGFLFSVHSPETTRRRFSEELRNNPRPVADVARFLTPSYDETPRTRRRRTPKKTPSSARSSAPAGGKTLEITSFESSILRGMERSKEFETKIEGERVVLAEIDRKETDLEEEGAQYRKELSDEYIRVVEELNQKQEDHREDHQAKREVLVEDRTTAKQNIRKYETQKRHTDGNVRDEKELLRLELASSGEQGLYRRTSLLFTKKTIVDKGLEKVSQLLTVSRNAIVTDYISELYKEGFGSNPACQERIENGLDEVWLDRIRQIDDNVEHYREFHARKGNATIQQLILRLAFFLDLEFDVNILP